MRTSSVGLFLLAAAALAAGCGPIGATSVIGDAEIAVARAHAADGDKYSIYETTGADLYLQKAREEQGHAEYSAAKDLARKSIELAEVATRKAAEAKRDPNRAEAPPPASERPAAPATREVIKPGARPPEPEAPPPPRRRTPPKPEAVEPEPARPDGGSPRVIRPGTSPDATQATPRGSPDAGTDAQPAPQSEPRRVIKPGEAPPDEAAPRRPKAPIDVDSGDKK